MNVKKYLLVGLSVLALNVVSLQTKITLKSALSMVGGQAYNIPHNETINAYPGYKKRDFFSLSYNRKLTSGRQANGLKVVRGSYPVSPTKWLASRKGKTLLEGGNTINYKLSIPKNAPEGTFTIIGTYENFENMGTAYVVHVKKSSKKKH